MLMRMPMLTKKVVRFFPPSKLKSAYSVHVNAAITCQHFVETQDERNHNEQKDYISLECCTSCGGEVVTHATSGFIAFPLST